MAAREKRNEGGGGAVCVLLDKESALLGRGEIESEEDAPNILVHVTGGETDRVAEADVVQIIPTSHQLAPRIGRVIFRRGNRITFEPMRQTGEAVRQNFRMAVDFASFVYPKTGGRAAIRALDLSCGGIAMYSAGEFAPGEICEVVIPITSDGPLLLDCQILRSSPYGGPIRLYAAKFLDLLHEQEAYLREAVFQAQLDSVQERKKSRK